MPENASNRGRAVLEELDFIVIDRACQGGTLREIARSLKVDQERLKASVKRIQSYLHKRAKPVAKSAATRRSDATARELAVQAQKSVDTLLTCLDHVR